MQVSSFSAKTPRFVPEEYFVGKTLGQGVFYDRFGRVQTSFRAELNGQLDGNLLTLEEKLVYESGETVHRTYKITRLSENNYEVRAADLDGVGLIQSFGNALQWNYRLKQKIGDSLWTLTFDDWMFLQNDGLVLNRATATKFGLEVGEVFMVISKR